MSIYHSKEGIEQYVEMADGYDGASLVELLHQHLGDGALLLELGMGPGKDLDLLSKFYNVTGSDFSDLFLDRYRETHPDADLLTLDAVDIDTDRVFDAIYSNKVLHHLNDLDLEKSAVAQAAVLHRRGLILHTFWYGHGIEEHAGMKFYMRDKSFLRKVFEPLFEIVVLDRYEEMEADDSLVMLARRRAG